MAKKTLLNGAKSSSTNSVALAGTEPMKNRLALAGTAPIKKKMTSSSVGSVALAGTSPISSSKTTSQVADTQPFSVSSIKLPFPCGSDYSENSADSANHCGDSTTGKNIS